jgi:hypothetical protein
MNDVTKDETIEDINDIEVELPNEDEVVEESTSKSEESVSNETTPETQESAETEETEEEEETSPDLEADDEQEEKPQNKTYGKRAEKRIKRLIKQKKELEEALAKSDEDRKSLSRNNDDLVSRNKDSEVQALESYVDKLEAQESQALSALRVAKEAGDIDAEIKATDILAQSKAETLVAKQYKARAETQAKSRQVSTSDTRVQPNVEPTAAPDRRALSWQKRNQWFGGGTRTDKVMTQAAMMIHNELIEEGVSAKVDAAEYYSELDARVREEFPEKFKNTSAKKSTTVIGGTRVTPGKQKVTLTRSEVDMADRLGVDYKEYARQKLRNLNAI